MKSGVPLGVLRNFSPWMLCAMPKSVSSRKGPMYSPCIAASASCSIRRKLACIQVHLRSEVQQRGIPLFLMRLHFPDILHALFALAAMQPFLNLRSPGNIPLSFVCQKEVARRLGRTGLHEAGLHCSQRCRLIDAINDAQCITLQGSIPCCGNAPV